MSKAIEKDILFKGLTRPALFFGVPLVPLFIAFAFAILLGIYTTKILYSLVFIPIYLGLRLYTSIDEEAFQLLGTRRFLFASRFRNRRAKHLFKATHYTFNNYKKESYNPTINNKRNLELLNLQNSTSIEEIIPYSSCLSDRTILTKKGHFIATWEIEGISFETRSNESLDQFKNAFANLLRTFANENIAFYTYNCKRSSQLNVEGKSLNSFANEITELYLEQFKKDQMMENHLYLSVVKTSSLINDKNDLENELKDFESICEKIDISLNKFGSTALLNYKEKNASFSPQLSFFNYLLTNDYQKVRVLEAPIYTYLGNIDLFFGKDIAEIRKGDKTFFTRSIEIKEWVKETHSGFLDILLKSNCNYVLTQSFSTLRKSEANKLIQRKGNQLKSSDDDALSQIDELPQAKDDLANGELSFGHHHITILIYADSIEKLKKHANEISSDLEDKGFITSYSHISFDEAYFAQLPSNFEFRPRLSLISNKNFAGLSDFHNNPIGKAKNNCWGEAVTILKTSQNAPYYLNFHQSKLGRNDLGEKHLGHTLILGKSGTGKTVLASFLLLQLLKFKTKEEKLTTIYFDKDYGAEIVVKAVGGQYNRLKSGKSTNFNPFLIENTAENIAFLNQLIAILVTQNGEKLTTSEKTQINKGINSLMCFDKIDRAYGITRLLENIQENVNDENSIYKRLSIWSKDNVNGWVFDNEVDTLAFEEYNVYGFDGTEILDNKEIITPLSFYLLHRIKSIADGRRLAIFMDEFWKWLHGDSFREFAYDGLKTLRKRNGFLVPITQSPDEIINSDISRAIIEQVETFIYLPNSNAQEEDYVNHFKCSKKEFQIISNLEDDSRQFLVKKGNASEGDQRGNTVICKLDLSNLGRENLKILSASTDNIFLLENIIAETGELPSSWINEFKQKCI